MKSIQYDYAESYAKAHGIAYKPTVNKYNQLEEIVYYGTAKDFFNQKKKAGFRQNTEFAGFGPDFTRSSGIDISIPSKLGYVVNVIYYVNLNEEDLIKVL